MFFKFHQQANLSSKVTAPATTGDATLVPDNDLQPPLPTTAQTNSGHCLNVT